MPYDVSVRDQDQSLAEQSPAESGRAVSEARRVEAPLKRTVDVILAVGGLAISLPVWPLIALAIKLEDGGSVFFKQDRPGLGAEPFTSWKFRTMQPDSDGRQATNDDPRITRVGELLRATALDELPQLWNILRGDMSFVGPRALPTVETKVDGNHEQLEDVPRFRERHSVRPGLTGLAQIRTPRTASTRTKFRYDLLYIRKRTLWLDLKLLATSIWISLRAGWPEVGRK